MMWKMIPVEWIPADVWRIVKNSIEEHQSKTQQEKPNGSKIETQGRGNLFEGVSFQTSTFATRVSPFGFGGFRNYLLRLFMGSALPPYARGWVKFFWLPVCFLQCNFQVFFTMQFPSAFYNANLVVFRLFYGIDTCLREKVSPHAPIGTILDRRHTG